MHLDIFDFDDTLCKSNSMINITNHKTGVKSVLSAKDWHTHQRDDENNDYDLSQFDNLSNQHEPNWNILRIAKETYNNAGSNGLRILTARAEAAGVQEFLDIYNMPDVKIYAIGSNADTPSGKAGYIERWIDELELTSVRYFEDAEEHVRAARELADRRPDVKFKIHFINA